MQIAPEEELKSTVEEAVEAGSLLETKTSHLHDILQEKLEQAFHKQTSTVVLHDIVKIASEHSPVDLAYAASRLPPNARPMIYENLSGIEAKIAFMVNTDTRTRVAILRFISDDEVKKLVEHMPPDEAVEILEDISERRFRKVLESLEASKALRIREIKKHQRNTAGRLMTNEFFAFSMDVTIGQVAAHIRNKPGIDLTRQIFVLNQEGELQGYVPARNLIVNPPQLPLKQVMKSILHTVTPDTSREEVVEIVERYKISALTVVDPNNRLLGVIDYEDVLDALEDIADETIANMAGTAEKVSEDETLIKRFFARAPWLVVTLCAGLINVGVMSSFQAYAGGVLTFVMFFVPLITGMSGNIGIQCSTVLVRSMALGLVSLGNKGEAMVKELLLGLTTGTVFGVLCGFVVYVLDFAGVSRVDVSPAAVGTIVGVGLTGACLAGTALGVFSPLFFARIGVDPAVAAGPIVTAFNDFLSMSIYFLIAIGLSALLF
ncbi:MAG: magnesium transporter [Candidatus Melainabacteria bacterium]|nr:magnesium transporter [Candidatus Melainabacteria bacterium]